MFIYLLTYFGNWFTNMLDFFSFGGNWNIYFGPLSLLFVLLEYYWHLYHFLQMPGVILIAIKRIHQRALNKAYMLFYFYL